ncbi:trypsin-like peptidase domain-containing protein [Actinoallomurus sp. NPDC052274]|uniref:trypsin-like serine peptidase n=1 Tax=Actinoallomurus sp. NPDC052274 TaxID=3155420 RepID=UPI0034232966
MNSRILAVATAAALAATWTLVELPGKTPHAVPTAAKAATKPGDYRPWPTPYGKDPVSRATGILWIYKPGKKTPSFCTASVVKSPSRSLILTAAHCVQSGIGPKAKYYKKFQFIPAFSAKADPKTGDKYDIKAPYGIWDVKKAWVSHAWQTSNASLWDGHPNRFSYIDVAVLSVAPDKRDRKIQDVVGGLTPKMTAKVSFPKFTTIGYPDEQTGKLRGNILSACSGKAAPASAKSGPGALYSAACVPGPGHSGGPWFSGTGADATVFGVTSAGALFPEGAMGARLRPDTFGKIFTAADRWSRAKR